MAVYKLTEADMSDNRIMGARTKFKDVVDDDGRAIRWENAADALAWAKVHRPGLMVVVEMVKYSDRESFALFAR